MALYTFVPNMAHRLIVFDMSLLIEDGEASIKNAFSILANLDGNGDLGYFEIQKLKIDGRPKNPPKYTYANLGNNHWEWGRSDCGPMPDNGRALLKHREAKEELEWLMEDGGEVKTYGDRKQARYILNGNPHCRFKKDTTNYRWYADPPEELGK